MSARQIYLLVCAVGIIPIALSYGLAPQTSLGFLFGIDVPAPNGVHIFRAVMGLYLALAVFWFIGFRKVSVRQSAIWSAVIFMLGLAAGRVLSLLVDGPANWLLETYLLLELAFGGVGILMLMRRD
jgi:hypothetical protein